MQAVWININRIPIITLHLIAYSTADEQLINVSN